MDLTADNVTSIIKYCLPPVVTKDQEAMALADKEIPGYTLAKGMVGGFLFEKKKLEERRADVASMLRQLPEEFLKGEGGGWSALNACVTNKGVHWGEHRNIDELLCLGLGLGLVEFCLPREMWRALPGGMPYFTVNMEALRRSIIVEG